MPHNEAWCSDSGDNGLAAEFIRDNRWDGLADAVEHQAKQCLIDIVGSMVGGALTPVSGIVAGYAPKAWPGDAATILLLKMLWNFEAVEDVGRRTALLRRR